MATGDLNRLALEFMRKDALNENPDDYEIRVNEFVAMLQAEGADVAQWGEAQWEEALGKLGVPADEFATVMENLAAWGVVDNFVWE